MLHGTWKVTGGSGPDIPVVPVAAAVLAVAFLSWLATHLLLLAAIAAALLAAIVAGLLLLRRHLNNPADAEALTGQAAALYADIAEHAPRPAVTVVNNYYMLPGATAKGAGRPVLPLRDAVTEIKED